MWESGKEIHEIEIHKLSNYFHVLDISCRCKLRQRNPLLVWTIRSCVMPVFFQFEPHGLVRNIQRESSRVAPMEIRHPGF